MTEGPAKGRRQSASARAARSALHLPFGAGVAAVLMLFLFLTALPVRNYLRQREELTMVRERVQTKQAEVAKLSSRLDALEDDGRVEELARAELGYVQPGEEAYAVLPPSQAGNAPVWLARLADFDPDTAITTPPAPAPQPSGASSPGDDASPGGRAAGTDTITTTTVASATRTGRTGSPATG